MQHEYVALGVKTAIVPLKYLTLAKRQKCLQAQICIAQCNPFTDKKEGGGAGNGQFY